MGTKMGPSYANLFIGYIENSSTNLMAPNLNFMAATSTIVLVLLLYLNVMINQVLLNARANDATLIHNADKRTGLRQSIKITDRFTCTSANVSYCITCSLCKRIYIGETGRRLGDCFREHLRDVERNDKDASKPVARHFNLANHSSQHTTICDRSLLQDNTENRQNLEQRFIF